jgi:hypothetical protein
MVNLSRAVNTYFMDLSEKPIDDNETILHKATSHDPSLLTPFPPDTYILKTNYQNPYAVLLLCTKDGDRAIMEDAGCSARLDRRVINVAPCEFTLRVSQNCHVEGADLLAAGIELWPVTFTASGSTFFLFSMYQQMYQQIYYT